MYRLFTKNMNRNIGSETAITITTAAISMGLDREETSSPGTDSANAARIAATNEATSATSSAYLKLG